MIHMHSLLKRQIAKFLPEEIPDGLRPFIEAVNQAYEESDKDRRMLERSMEISSQEMLQANLEMRALQSGLETRVKARTADLYKLNEAFLAEIIERKSTEEKVRESEARFRQVIAAADAIPYSRDYTSDFTSDRYTFIGEETTKLAGYSLAEITPALLDSITVESIMYGRFKGVSFLEAIRHLRQGGNMVFWQCSLRHHTPLWKGISL